ncbi:hypothetical protein KGM_202666 [Danaus plexippus plexippus]|uniref:Uncharacterized protein n=1 Tax=Danaus plexippus plexippus TaxID=278856 RepID=A0A212F8W2_DANPL|nr:hypothetical protein KGM_202666 [Danaus plexippus plexippus]
MSDSTNSTNTLLAPDNHLGRWRNITFHLPSNAVSWYHQYVEHCTSSPSHTHTHTQAHYRSHTVCAAVPGAQQLTGGALPSPRGPLLSPSLPPVSPTCLTPPLSWCVRHTPRLVPHPTSNPLFTDGRPVSGAFAVPAASRSFKFNALPMSGL